MAQFVSFGVDLKGFNRFVQDAVDKTGDLRLAWLEIGIDIYKSNKKLFLLRGPGQFVDLSPAYKKRKAAKLKSAYPILRGFTGLLEKSITSNTDKNAVFRVSKESFSIGTKVKTKKGFLYPLALQEGTSKMPARPFLFVDPPRVKRWTNIINKTLREMYENKGWTN